MHQVILVDEKMLAAPLESDDADYLHKVSAHLKPIGDDEYMNGVALFLQPWRASVTCFTIAICTGASNGNRA